MSRWSEHEFTHETLDGETVTVSVEFYATGTPQEPELAIDGAVLVNEEPVKWIALDESHLDSEEHRRIFNHINKLMDHALEYHFEAISQSLIEREMERERE